MRRLPEAVMPAMPINKVLKGQKALVTGANSGTGWPSFTQPVQGTDIGLGNGGNYSQDPRCHQNDGWLLGRHYREPGLL